jgi:hypothetical protein
MPQLRANPSRAPEVLAEVARNLFRAPAITSQVRRNAAVLTLRTSGEHRHRFPGEVRTSGKERHPFPRPILDVQNPPERLPPPSLDVRTGPTDFPRAIPGHRGRSKTFSLTKLGRQRRSTERYRAAVHEGDSGFLLQINDKARSGLAGRLCSGRDCHRRLLRNSCGSKKEHPRRD